MSVRWHAHPDAEAAAAACSRHIVMLLEEALSGESEATFAISGGSTPKTLFTHLARTPFDWSHVHLFWVDERAVPPSDAQSNYRLAEECLIAPARIPRRNVHRVLTELPPAKAAARYAEDIREFLGIADGELPHFDVVHLGTGSDAHTASLFPGEKLLQDREGVTAAVFVDKIAQWRITLLPGALLAARHTVFLVTGADKAEAVRTIFHEPYDPMLYPAQLVSHHGRRVTWFLDESAASLMD